MSKETHPLVFIGLCLCRFLVLELSFINDQATIVPRFISISLVFHRPLKPNELKRRVALCCRLDYVSFRPLCGEKLHTARAHAGKLRELGKHSNIVSASSTGGTLQAAKSVVFSIRNKSKNENIVMPVIVIV